MAAGLVAGLVALVLAGGSSAATTRARGIDVSNWNGTIAWPKVAGAGYRFVFAKATEGTTFVDSTYAANRSGSEAAGLVFGAYHFARPAGSSAARATASAVAQADHFLATATPQPGELPPVLDLETTGGLGPSLLQLWTQAWLAEIYASTGVEPFVYTSPAFWSSKLADSTTAAASGAGLWIAHWTKASGPTLPAQSWDDAGWTFWQWTNCLSVPGIPHCTDGDRMDGSNPASVAIEPYPSGLPILSTPPGIVGTPEAGDRLAAVPGTWAGGKPLQFAYQWERCDAAGASCAAITGATKETYTAVTADVGHSIEVVTTASSDAGSAEAAAAPSSAVSPAGTKPSARPANISPPQVLGTPQAGQSLTSSVGTWTGSPKRFTYHWRRCDATGASCVAIRHATHSSYTLTPGEIGSTISLLVTATGAGGAATTGAALTDVVVAAPLPPISTGTQTVEPGVAGNVQTDDATAYATWQPGAVPVGLTVLLDSFDSKVAVGGSAVALTIPNLRAKKLRWPIDLSYAQTQPPETVLGYSSDGKVFDLVPPLQQAVLPTGTDIGSYLSADGLLHVLTRTPVQIALFARRGWGDPTYTAPKGPSLTRQGKVRVLVRRSQHSVLVLTRLRANAQTRLRVKVNVRHSRRRVISVLGRGSRLGTLLRPHGSFHVVRTQRNRPGTVRVRLRLNGWTLRSGSYVVHVVAVDPWGRHDHLSFRFRY